MEIIEHQETDFRNEKEFIAWKKYSDVGLSKTDKERLYSRILASSMRSRKTRRRRIIYFTAAAACIALLAVSTVVLLQRQSYWENNLHHADELAHGATTSNQIRFISGDTVVEIGENAQLAQNQDGSMSVMQATNVSNISLSHNVMNKLIVPAGRLSTLQLSDGTKIWLNSGTELHFPSNFSSHSREIRVIGEIYVEVAASQTPFYVNTSLFRLKVHGTKFNVFAFDENEENNVTLVEGSVEIVTQNRHTIWLSPNEKAVVSPIEAYKTRVNVEEYISWTEGVLIFNKTPFSVVLKKIGRHYDVKFVNDSGNDLSEKTCTGKLFLSEDFEEILISLSALASTQFRREGNVIHLVKENEQ